VVDVEVELVDVLWLVDSDVLEVEVDCDVDVLWLVLDVLMEREVEVD
jgi:hypothetical protein